LIFHVLCPCVEVFSLDNCIVKPSYTKEWGNFCRKKLFGMVGHREVALAFVSPEMHPAWDLFCSNQCQQWS
jgi:hypothetical protein